MNILNMFQDFLIWLNEKAMNRLYYGTIVIPIKLVNTILRLLQSENIKSYFIVTLLWICFIGWYFFKRMSG